MRRRRRRSRSAPAQRVEPLTLGRALAHIDGQAPVRRHRVDAARRAVAADSFPSADAVAEMVMRRSVCDRLR